MTKENKALLITIPTAFLLFFISFVVPVGIFWVKIAISASILAITAGVLVPYSKDKFEKRHLVTGIGSALLMYFIFYMGNIILPMIIPGSGEGISNVYAMKESFPKYGIALLLIFVTSPAEEFFWRGFLQRTLTGKFGKWKGFIFATLLYSAVHIFTLNLPLILAALTAGTVWGFLYTIEKNVIPLIISHALWTVLIFLVFPVA